LIGAAEIRLPKASRLSLAFDIGRWSEVHDGTAWIALRLTAEAILEKGRLD
jgi:hypothetical protein